MSEETLNYLDELVRNEVSYKISSLIITAMLLLALCGFWIYCLIKDKQTKKFRDEWRDTLTKEQKQALKEEEKLKVK